MNSGVRCLSRQGAAAPFPRPKQRGRFKSEKWTAIKSRELADRALPVAAGVLHSCLAAGKHPLLPKPNMPFYAAFAAVNCGHTTHLSHTEELVYFVEGCERDVPRSCKCKLRECPRGRTCDCLHVVWSCDGDYSRMACRVPA